jgi:outer membrane lipoprotein LolB
MALTQFTSERLMRLLPCYFLLLALLNGCANYSAKPQLPLQSQDWATHQAQVMAVTEWQAFGKLGIKLPDDGGSANLHWSHRPQEYQIDLTGPLGFSKISINGKASGVTFSQGGGAAQTAKTPEELIAKNTGWNIPVTQLAYWVRGLPAPRAKVTQYHFNAQGMLGDLEQMGWKIVYGDYLQLLDPHTQNIALPRKITAEYKDVRLTLLIREWTLGAAL